jgi:hypothetical protein
MVHESIEQAHAKNQADADYKERGDKIINNPPKNNLYKPFD